jgi:Peptide-N-glycosidase F, C terminal
LARTLAALGVALTVAGCGSSSPAPHATGAGGAPSDGGKEAAAPPKPFTIDAFDNVRISSHSDEPNYQGATANIDFGSGPFKSVTMNVSLGTTCYPFSGWSSDPPPQGQNWPADCDAFDRNFEFSLDDPPSGSSTPPGLEVVRAITPFGGPEQFQVDLTDVANGLPGKHALSVLITTYSDAAGQVSGSDGGWNVTAKIDVVPGKEPRKVLAVEPLYYGSVGAGDVVQPIAFTVPQGTNMARIEYRVTGHGGAAPNSDCIGPAEEFCERTHVVSVDGTQIAKLQPWRTDCANFCTIQTYQGMQYCEQNPCGAIQSVQASRANWCPGSVTDPFDLTAPSLKAAGSHTFSWNIESIATGGTWRVSATYFALGGS